MLKLCELGIRGLGMLGVVLDGGEEATPPHPAPSRSIGSGDARGEGWSFAGALDHGCSELRQELWEGQSGVASGVRLLWAEV